MKDIFVLLLSAAVVTLVSARSVSKELVELTYSLNNQFDFGDTNDQEFFDLLGIKQNFEDYYDGGQSEDYRHVFEDDGKKEYQGEYDEVERAAGAIESNESYDKQKSLIYDNELHNQENMVFNVNTLEDVSSEQEDFRNNKEENENSNIEKDTGRQNNIMVKSNSKNKSKTNDFSVFNGEGKLEEEISEEAVNIGEDVGEEEAEVVSEEEINHKDSEQHFEYAYENTDDIDSNEDEYADYVEDEEEEEEEEEEKEEEDEDNDYNNKDIFEYNDDNDSEYDYDGNEDEYEEENKEENYEENEEYVKESKEDSFRNREDYYYDDFYENK